MTYVTPRSADGSAEATWRNVQGFGELPRLHLHRGRRRWSGELDDPQTKASG